MARGIGGDDGPSLWMFIAVVLIWGKIQGWFNSAKDSLSGNLANPLQPETTEQIRLKEKAVKSVSYKASNLAHPIAFYQQIADSQYNEMHGLGNTDEDKMINQLKGLNKDELIAVYKAFGVRDSTYMTFGLLATGTGNLFEWYEECLSDSLLGGQDLATMRKIWKPTGLWASF